jgi:hypothetical protein
MSATLNSTGVSFSDSTSQTTAGIPLTGGTPTGTVIMPQLKVFNGNTSPGSNYNANDMRNIRQWYWSATMSANSTYDLVSNSNAYDDVTFQLILVGYSGYIIYPMWWGCFGGYGINYTSMGSGGGPYYSLTTSSISSGYSKLQITVGSVNGGSAGVYLSMTVYGKNPITPINGSFI